jgi:hypothetical protein
MDMDKMLTVVSYCSLQKKPSFNSVKYCDIPEGNIVWYNKDELVMADGVSWNEVLYNSSTATYIGFVPNYAVELFTPSLYGYNIIKIANQTKNDSDMAQDIVYKKNIQYNVCGEFSVLFCAKWFEFTIEDWLDEWNLKSPSVFNRIFYGGRSRTTGVLDLTDMFKTFDGYPKTFSMITDRFKYNNKIIFSPHKISEVLADSKFIIGCNIEGQYGELRSSGIPHWIVLEAITPEERGAVVHYYNPATNSIRTADWYSFISSVTRNPYGIVVPR